MVQSNTGTAMRNEVMQFSLANIKYEEEYGTKSYTKGTFP